MTSHSPKKEEDRRDSDVTVARMSGLFPRKSLST